MFPISILIMNREHSSYRKDPKQVFFYVLIKSWNTYNYLQFCLDSVLKQTYKNYKILFIDDASDFTSSQKEKIKQKLKGHIVKFNKNRRFAVYNSYRMIHEFANLKDSVVLNLDGDDWLYNRSALQNLSKVYSSSGKTPLLTYGSCLVWDGKKLLKKSSKFSFPLSNTRYPEITEKKSLYRKVPFRAFHPMTFKTDLFKKIRERDFKEDNGNWLRYCPDLASFLPMLEMANGRYAVIKKKLYVYNIATSESNLNKNLYNFIREPVIIRKKNKYEPII